MVRDRPALEIPATTIATVPEEIEVTPAMIEAGASVVWDWFDDFLAFGSTWQWKASGNEVRVNTDGVIL
jgi:hypothetical protein